MIYMKHIQFSGLICVKNMRPVGQLLNEMVFPFLSVLTRRSPGKPEPSVAGGG